MRKLVGTDKWRFVNLTCVKPEPMKDQYPVRVTPEGVGDIILDRIYNDIFKEVCPDFLMWLRQEVEDATKKTEA